LFNVAPSSALHLLSSSPFSSSHYHRLSAAIIPSFDIINSTFENITISTSSGGSDSAFGGGILNAQLISGSLVSISNSTFNNISVVIYNEENSDIGIIFFFLKCVFTLGSSFSSILYLSGILSESTTDFPFISIIDSIFTPGVQIISGFFFYNRLFV
jgi:hypothetical protein